MVKNPSSKAGFRFNLSVVPGRAQNFYRMNLPVFVSIFAAITTASAAGGALPEQIFTTGHSDVRIDYATSSDTWALSIDRGTNGIDGGALFAPEQAVMVLSPAARTTVPALPSQWDFLGEAGDDIWILPQSFASGVLFLGFNQFGVSSGVFDGGGLGNVALTLTDHDGPADFALYSVQSGQPTLFWDTRPADGPFGFRTLGAGGHSHANWAFRGRGIHFLTLQASGTLLENGMSTASAPTVYTFAVEPEPWHWWQLEHFGLKANQAEALPDADRDGDGAPNLLEYALGLDPHSDSRAGLPFVSTSVDQGELYLTLAFRRPEGRSDIRYAVEVSDDLLDWEEIENAERNADSLRTDTDGVEWLSVRDGQPFRTHESRFMRLRIIR